MLGLDNATAMVAVTGLEENGLVGKTLLAMDGQPQGLLRLVSDRPLQPADLTPIPRDATLALAARFDLQQAVEIVPRSSLEMGHHADWLDLALFDRQLHVTSAATSWLRWAIPGGSITRRPRAGWSSPA